jgi:hypothetical protein
MKRNSLTGSCSSLLVSPIELVNSRDASLTDNLSDENFTQRLKKIKLPQESD